CFTSRPPRPAPRCPYTTLFRSISTMTVTGRAEAVRRFKDRAILIFAPLDTPVAVSRWLKRIRPQLAMVAETEIWPELYIGCQKRSEEHTSELQSRFDLVCRHLL